MIYDAIVVGVGGMGSATTYHLARHGAKVLALEQFNIPNSLGSSHGINRIIRLAYAEDSRYVPLLRRAYELWRELEHSSGERLLIITGCVDAGPETGDIVSGSLRSCATFQLPHEVLDHVALERKFPGYQFPNGIVGVYQPDGGFLLSERCIVSYVIAAQSIGADVHGRERVLEWKIDQSNVLVRTQRGDYAGRKLIFTAGPWSSVLFPRLSRLAIPERQVVIWTQPLVPEQFKLGVFPVFNMEGEEGRFYGFPIYGIPGFKIGKYHHLKQSVDLNSLDRESYDSADEDVLREGIRRYFPNANGPTIALKTCLFTNSPDNHFIIDSHPDIPNVYVAAGFSGHGFKFCSVVGEIMADLALHGGTRHDISLFALNRFRQ
jgi:sarcosine oxidase